MTDTAGRPWNYTQMERAKMRRDKALRLHDAGWSIKDIAAELEVSRRIVEMYLKKERT